MIHAAKASHIGTCLSMADILAVLYDTILKIDPKDPSWLNRDRFILSKGHGAAIYYAVLARCGFFSRKLLTEYSKNGSKLAGHVTHYGVPGVELSTGSLGHGLPLGCGIALTAKKDKEKYHVFILLSDGEMDEGSNWEALLFAAHHKLDNLTVIIDHNKLQGLGRVKDVLDLGSLADKGRSFGWGVKEIDGHDHGQLHATLGNLPLNKGLPSLIIAHTIKGKGVDYMEDKLEWHYKSPTDTQLKEAIRKLR